MQHGVVWLALLVVPVHGAKTTIEPERVTYKTSDGVQIVADYYAPKAQGDRKAPVVILLHQYPSTRDSWAPLVPLFHDAGYALLAPDLRGHGKSIEPKTMQLEQGKSRRDPQHYRAAYKDVLGAYEWLRGRKEVDLSRLALIGASIGSSIALDYAVRDRSVDVVVCLSPGPNYFGVDSLRDAENYGKRPLLLISPRNERDRSEALARQNRNATVKIIQNTELHGTFMFGKVPNIEKTIFDFVQAHIGKPNKDGVVASLAGKGRFHDPGCAYVRGESSNRIAMSPSNRRLFSTSQEASDRGYSPCRKCIQTKVAAGGE